MTDYGLSNLFHDEVERLTLAEGCRLDLYTLGILILKMLGKMRLHSQNSSDSSYYL